MTPQREAYYQSMTQEEYEDRVMFLYFKSCITSYKKKINRLVKTYPDEPKRASLRFLKTMLRVTKKRLIEAKKKLPNRKVDSNEIRTSD